MIETVRLYVEAALLVGIALALAIIAAFAAAAVTGDRLSVMATAGAVFCLTGATLAFRAWRRVSKPGLLQPEPNPKPQTATVPIP
jgi:hypothetical protein